MRNIVSRHPLVIIGGGLARLAAVNLLARNGFCSRGTLGQQSNYLETDGPKTRRVPRRARQRSLGQRQFVTVRLELFRRNS